MVTVLALLTPVLKLREFRAGRDCHVMVPTLLRAGRLRVDSRVTLASLNVPEIEARDEDVREMTAPLFSRVRSPSIVLAPDRSIVGSEVAGIRTSPLSVLQEERAVASAAEPTVKVDCVQEDCAGDTC